MHKALTALVLAAFIVPSALAFTSEIPATITVNDPPATPTLTGPVNGETGTSYTYTAVSTDPDGDDISYCFFWGDGTEVCTSEMKRSGEAAQASHIWNADGDYTISVKATDENGAESALATLRVTMPRDIDTQHVENSYSGTLRIYIAEPVSRWDNYDDNPYHYGFLDYAYNDQLSIAFGETWEETINWNAADAGYGDVTEDNIITIAAVFNPKINKAYASPPAGNSFEAHYVDAAAGVTPGETESNFKDETFTHTVFGEEITATWCPYCPAMAEALNGVYQSGDYPFYFVAMVGDKNDQVADRIEDYNLAGYPSVFFDGGRRVIVGGYEEETRYRTAIDYAGTKDVHDLDLTLSSDWNNGQLAITVVITNNEIYVNDPPATPTLTGPVEGETGTSYTYTAVSTDPDGDELTYCFTWGDGTEFCTPTTYSSGEAVEASHIWSAEGDYMISVKAIDVNGAESEPATLSVTMPLDISSDPEVRISKPRNGIYAFGFKVLPILGQVVFGDVTVEALVSDDVIRVEFILQTIGCGREIVHVDTTPPFTWDWDQDYNDDELIDEGNVPLMVRAYDSNYESTTDTLRLIKLG